MVKKVQKVASILAAGALLFGFAACHNDSGSDPTPKVNSVALNQTSLTLVKDSEYTLEATVSVSDGASKEVTWSSSDTDGTYLTLDNGKITAVSATSEAVTVTATSKADFTKSATCSVTVVDSKEEQIGIANAGTYTIDGTTITINEDGTATAADGTTSVSVDVNEDGDIVITIGDKTYTATPDETTGVIDTSTVKNSDGTVVTVEKKAAEEQNDDEPEDAALEATVFWNVTEYVAQVGSDSATSYTENKTYGSVEAIQPFSLRNAAAANSYTLIETNDLSCTGYLQVAADGSIESGKEKKALKFTVPANTKKVSIIAKCGSSSKPANLTLSDGTTAYINKAPSTTYELHTTEELNLSADTVLYLYNAEGSGQGGLNIQAIVLWSEAVVLDPPTATNFTANSTAEGYSITISGADAEKAAGLEYSTDNGTTWTSVTGTTITLTTYGTVKIRYKATDEAGASKAISVTVQEYVDDTLETPSAPDASKFSATDVATAGGKGSITIDSSITPTTLEYKLGTDGTVTAVTGATLSDLAAGDYYFRYKAVAGKSNASEFTKVTVAAYVSPSVYTLTGASAEIVLGKTQIEAENYLAYDGSYASSSASTTTVGGNEITVERTDLKSAKSLDITVSGVKSFVVYVKSDGGADRTFDVKLDGTKVGTVICTEKVLLSGTAGGSDAKYQDVFGYTFNTNDTGAQTKISLVGGNKSVYPMYIVLKNAASEIPVESVTITGKPASNTLIKGNSVMLGATVAPDRATAKTIAWSIENLENGTKSAEEFAQIATITDAGVLSAVGEGQVVVVATAPSGAKDSFMLNVQGSAVYATEVTLKIGNDAAGTGGEWGKGKTFTLVPTVTAEGNATPTDDTVSWSSDKESVATVSSAGVVTVVAASGTATITATANGSEAAGAVTATYVVTATPVYVVAGKYFTGKQRTSSSKDVFEGQSDYTVDGSSTAVWTAITISNDTPADPQVHDGIYANCKLDSGGFNLYSDTTKKGCVTFTISSALKLSYTDTAGKGVTITPASGATCSKVSDTDSAVTITNDGVANTTGVTEVSVNLSAGSYTISGSSSSAAKLLYLRFEAQ